MRILFDSGSQISYISPSAAKTLKLQPFDSKEICIKSFGEHSTTKRLDVLKFDVKSKSGNIPVTVLCNEICLMITTSFRSFLVHCLYRLIS